MLDPRTALKIQDSEDEYLANKKIDIKSLINQSKLKRMEVNPKISINSLKNRDHTKKADSILSPSIP